MSKKTVFAAFVAGIVAANALRHVHIKVRTDTDDEPIDPAPAPTASQLVPRPGRPRPQMRKNAPSHAVKRYK